MTLQAIRETEPSFAAIAVELKVGETKMAELSLATAILAMITASNHYGLERLAAEIGLESEAARRIILDEKHFAGLIAEAHRLFKAMIPYEEVIRRVIGTRS